MKTVLTPVRREEIAALAGHYLHKHKGRSIDEVAEREGIILVRMPDESVSARGYATAFPKGKRRKRIPSLAHPGEYLISECEWETLWQECIVINTALLGETHPQPLSRGECDSPLERGEGCVHPASEAFVFWHEFYHLGYSPTRNTAKFFHSFSTTGALDAQEERRANEFAGLMVKGH